MALTDYKQLIAWQKSIDVVELVYRATACFPRDEIYGLTNQLRRAAVSIPSNIAEGQGRSSKAEFDRFLLIANGSRQEVETQLVIAERLGYLEREQLTGLLDLLHEIGRIISGLRASLRRRL
jgi:four helix bundle protein